MLKMIIADDEFIVRNGLKNIIDWAELGIEVIADAVDGQEAYELCQQLQPDILFTDIRMPMMDGLEVAYKLKEEGCNVKIIIISGVQDFNYARTALSLNAAGYILKPVKITELKEIVKKVVNTINMEKNSEERIHSLKRQLHSNLSAMREKFLRSLISGLYINESEVVGRVSYFSLPFKSDDNFTSAVLQIDDFNAAVQNFKEENRQLLTFAVSNITEEIVSNYSCGLCLSTQENELVIIFNSKNSSTERYTDICQDIISCLNKFLDVSVSLGIGSCVNSLLDLSISYNEALTALQHKFYTGNNSVLSFKDVKLNKNGLNYPDLYKNESQLMNYVKLGDSIGALNTIEEIFKHLCLKGNLPVDYVQSVCIELISISARNVYELGENLDSIIENRSVILDNIYSISTIFGLKSYLSEIFLTITEYFSKKYNQKNLKVIQRIKDILDTQYMKNIGVLDIAKEVYLSPNYISLIFKQETGETITEYLTKVRIGQAKELLKETDFKILEIAEMVGYENPNYFSTVFKKYTGMHPQKYRV